MNCKISLSCVIIKQNNEIHKNMLNYVKFLHYKRIILFTCNDYETILFYSVETGTYKK